MGWGKLTERQCEVLKPHVKGQIVFDVGAGDRELSLLLRHQLGAGLVVAIDKDPYGPPQGDVCVFTGRYSAFITAFGAIEHGVGFVSFPQNSPVATEIVRLVKDIPTLVYVGSNVQHTSCGNRQFFEHLLTRPLLAEVPGNNFQTMLVLGDRRDLEHKRVPTAEEAAALEQFCRPIYAHDED